MLSRGLWLPTDKNIKWIWCHYSDLGSNKKIFCFVPSIDEDYIEYKESTPELKYRKVRLYPIHEEQKKLNIWFGGGVRWNYNRTEMHFHDKLNYIDRNLELNWLKNIIMKSDHTRSL
ncbi:6036_t:CDS:1 [Gigaspora rosea]|nr:6036_t:CDS:1 [Gigaspora rosea]